MRSSTSSNMCLLVSVRTSVPQRLGYKYLTIYFLYALSVKRHFLANQTIKLYNDQVGTIDLSRTRRDSN